MKTYTSLIAFLFLCSLGNAEDWPSWRGADRTGISKETGLLQEWPEGGPQKVWSSTDAGMGYSGFSVVK